MESSAPVSHRRNQSAVEIPEVGHLVRQRWNEDKQDNFAATVGYSGSHSYDIVGNGNSSGLCLTEWTSMSCRRPDHHRALAPTRLNPSFGSIKYADNDRYGNYNAVFFDCKGTFLARLRGLLLHSFPIEG